MRVALWVVVSACSLTAGDRWDRQIALAEQYRQQGQYAAAVTVLEDLVQQPPGDERLALALHNLAYAQLMRGSYTEAERNFERCLAVLGQGRAQNPLAWRALNSLTAMYIGSGQLAKAEQTSRRLGEYLAGSPSPERFTLRNNQAYLHLLAARYDAAIALLRPTIQEAVAVPDIPPDIVAGLFNTLGLALQRTGQAAGAAAAFESALAALKSSGPDNAVVARQLTNLAGAYRQAGDPKLGNSTVERALAILEVQVGPKHPAFAAALLEHAACLRALHRASQARPLEKRAHAILRQYADENHLGRTVDVAALR